MSSFSQKKDIKLLQQMDMIKEKISGFDKGFRKGRVHKQEL
jgi:hypothetical protein